MRRSIILLCFVLCLIAFWLMRTAWEPKEAKKPSSTPQVPSTATASISTSTPPKVEKASAVRKPLKISSKGQVRLKPGESAVLGYWEIAPGMNGMAIVTPETTPEGHVKMMAKLLHLSDAAVADAEAHDLFPDIFDFENYSAIGPERLRELQTALQSKRGVDMLSMPSVVSAAGQQARISIGNSNDNQLSLGLRADPVAENRGYDLSLDFQRLE
jgi:hypothetical protein